MWYLGRRLIGPALFVLAIALLSPRATSPDGVTVSGPGRIVFESVDAEGVERWEVSSPGGSGRSLAASSAASRAALAPDGGSAVFGCAPALLTASSDPDENTGVCRVDLLSGSVGLVLDTGQPVQHPTPSPDGASILFASGAEADHGLKVIGHDGGPVESLCDGFCPLYRFYDISWSPDGSRVAFVATTPGSGGHLPQIYVVTVGESDYTQLTHTRGVESDPAWSPDGRMLAFASSRTGDTELWVMRSDGSDQRQITRRAGPDIEPAWSPDGTELVFTRHLDRSWDLAVLAVASGEVRALTVGGGTESNPVWLCSDGVV